MNGKVYIHEMVDILGHNRARYLHHMTANWCPVAREERAQLCVGVWATVGSTGRWPEVVNLWEHDGWDGLAASFAHETGGGRDQDPTLAAWWAGAAALRRGGVDRILVPAPWTRTVDELVADGVRGVVYAHELVTLPPGRAGAFLAELHEVGLPPVAALGLDLVGAYEVAMGAGTECVVLWAVPDWPAWARYERAWAAGGHLDGWRTVLIGLGATWRRQLLVDSPLNPLRTGRQPQESDRLPLDEIP
jgi:hypothetical protein